MRLRASRDRSPAAAIGLLAIAWSLAACGDVAINPEATPVVGTGPVVTEDRTAGAVERISVGAGIRVVIRTGEPGSVTVSAQENVLPAVVTEVRAGQLIVNVPLPRYESDEPVTLTVVAPRITSVTLSAGAIGQLELAETDLRVDLSGRASVTGVGRLDSLVLTSSSDARIDFTQLIAGTAEITMSGGSAATLTVEEAISGGASGGATVTLTTPTPIVSVETTSGGSVQGGPPPTP